MKYGKTLIIFGIVNILAIFSGLPTGWKRFLVTGISLIIISIGWILHTLNKKRKERALYQASAVEQEAQQELNDIADVIVVDVSNRVEKEIDRI